MLEPIRTYLFEREKRKRLSEAKPRVPYFRKDRKNHFGILLDASQPEDRAEVVALAEHLRKDGHRVKILGFMQGYHEGLNFPFDIFTSSDLSKVTQVPKSQIVDQFLEQPFDVLINMSITINHKPLDYICSVSPASFRIGPWFLHQADNPYDLCLDTGTSSTLKAWISELLNTLQKIY